MPSYLTPGVYVEEVASSSATLSAGATAVAAFVGFTAKAPKDDPSDPEGLKPRLVTNWTQFERSVRRVRAGRHAPALGLRVLQQRWVDGLHRSHPEHGAVDGVGPARAHLRRSCARPGGRVHDRRAERRRHRHGHPRACGRRRRRRRADVRSHDQRAATASPRSSPASRWAASTRPSTAPPPR